VLNVGAIVQIAALAPAADQAGMHQLLEVERQRGRRQLQLLYQLGRLGPLRAALHEQTKYGPLKIGIAWQGSQLAIDIGRSFPLALVQRLAAVPGVRLISLQKDAGSEQLKSIPEGMRVEDFGARLDRGADAFLDTAAIMANVDLVITSDTSIAHLAGALGRPTWVALKHVPDWRWLLGRQDSPWYPSHRLFRQEGPGIWESVFERMHTELLTLAAARPTAGV
jgi:Glycosyltransferase family 9 (heptosyltransferase)